MACSRRLRWLRDAGTDQDCRNAGARQGTLPITTFSEVIFVQATLGRPVGAGLLPQPTVGRGRWDRSSERSRAIVLRCFRPQQVARIALRRSVDVTDADWRESTLCWVGQTEAPDAEEQKTRNMSLATGALINYPDGAGVMEKNSRACRAGVARAISEPARTQPPWLRTARVSHRRGEPET